MKFILLALGVLLAWFYIQPQTVDVPETAPEASSIEMEASTPQPPVPITIDQDEFAQAFEQRRSDLQLEGQGVVVKLLPDDLDGSRHQKFLVRLASGQTLLVAHNIDLAPRVDGLQEGAMIKFFGEYEWNEKGGVMHWTHHDPQGHHVAGWLEYQGRRYS
jgi:hypothetical protein